MIYYCIKGIKHCILAKILKIDNKRQKNQVIFEYFTF